MKHLLTAAMPRDEAVALLDLAEDMHQIQDRETDRSGPAQLRQGVEGGADGPAGVEHVVDEHDDLVVDPGLGDAGAVCRPRRLATQVVAVQCHVELADRHGDAFHRLDRGAEPLGERHSAGGDSEEDEVGSALVALEDLVPDAP